MVNAIRKYEAGFTLVELIIVIVVLGVLTAYAAMRGGSAGEFTLLSQAETFASDLRHAQTLATTMGRSLRISITEGPNGSYSVSCITSVAPPCNSTAGLTMINPATGSAFTGTLEKGVALSGPTLEINSLGKPVAGAPASYLLQYGQVSKSVSVATITGFISVP